MTFDDEFDGPQGAPPQQLRWLHDTGGTGWGDNQLQYYTDDVANAQLDGAGHLAITAHQASQSLPCWYGPCRYTSAKITTRQPQLALFSQGYGHFEARLKMPVGKGLWPAFWLIGENLAWAGTDKAGEIDVMEALGDQPRQVEQHAHGPGLDFGGPTALPPGQSVSDWHVYAINWTPDRIDWQVDGRTTETLTRAEAGNTGWVFDHPFYLALNTAVGGGWPGDPGKMTVFPATMLVDYVRVYEIDERHTATTPAVSEGE
ncbi:MAG TPA: glycoside hydrolase family 16 protein [Actinomycetospora sp.]|jgi:beta-glucanase (GH16 family)|uniref:glycoside hydrolase family 16 protein n=1 Tax=Actinomycetospora sp. TaxID=1872135 RepID=UPI002F3E9873